MRSLAILLACATASGQERVDQVAAILDIHPSADPDQALLEVERASLLVDSTLARLEREQFEAASAREAFRSRNARSTTTWNLAAVLVGSGTSAVGSALQFGTQRQALAGDGLIIAGSVIAAAFTVTALVERDRGGPLYAIETNFLAPLFDRAPTKGSQLPDPIWQYLDTPLAGETGSFRRQLVERFTREGRLSSAHEIDLLTRPISSHDLVSSAVLGVRVDMLSDLRSRVVAIKLDLSRLIDRISSRNSAPPDSR